MMYMDPLRNDMRGMLEDMLTLAKERNPKIRTMRATITDSENGTYIAFRALDANDNLIANYANFIEKEGNE